MHFEPLIEPTPWPPPEVCEGYVRPKKRGLARFNPWIAPRDPIAIDIQDQICAQMVSRPASADWPMDALEREIVTALSRAFCLEKGLPEDEVALHPGDRLSLLLWGAGPDDITAPMFSSELSTRGITCFDWVDLWKFMIDTSLWKTAQERLALATSQKTVGELVAFVAAKHRQSEPVRRKPSLPWRMGNAIRRFRR